MKSNLGIKLYRNLPGDRMIWLVWGLLAICSMLAVYSAAGTLAFQSHGYTETYLLKQVIFLIIGGGITYACAMIPYNQFNKLAPFLLTIVIALLFITLFFGVEKNEARRWLSIPMTGLTIQTSDIAKFVIIIYLARVISYKQDVITDIRKAFFPLIFPVIIICGLISPADLSTAIMLFVTCVFMLFIGRIDFKFILMLLAMAVIVGLFLFVLGETFPDYIRSTTWISRLKDFFYEGGNNWQINQAKIAIAEGDWFGRGPGNSIQRNYLPYPYADFIYAIICEEFGLTGALVVIGLYTMVLFRATALLTKFPKAFGGLVAVGLALNIVIQAFMNIAVSVDLVPVTGLTLPMISMGGTSLIFTCVAFGIILSVSKHQEDLEKQSATQ